MFVRRRDAKKRAERRRKQYRKMKLREEKQVKHKLMENRDRTRKEYWDQMWKFDGFDINADDTENGPMVVYDEYDVDDDDDDDDDEEEDDVYSNYRDRLTFGAKVGLDWYNMRHKTSWQFQRIEKYNKMPIGMMRWDYYITLVAQDPQGFLKHFQTAFRHGQFTVVDVTWFISRPRPPPSGVAGVRPSVPTYQHIRNAEWPSNFNDNKKYHVLPESQWLANDRIRLYLDLAFVTAIRTNSNPKLSDFKITMVAVETEEDVQHPSQILDDPINAVFYIMYEPYSAEGQVGTTCKAILRRTVDLALGYFNLTGFPESI